MRSLTRVLVAGAAVVAVGYASLSAAAAATADSKAAMSEKEKAQKEPFPNDFGPDTIDVSAYPADMQKKYETFHKCGQCHSIARPINSQIWKDEDWKRYVKRMMAKPGCEIGKAGKDIYEFLKFDSNERKVKHKAEFKAHRLDLLKSFHDKYADRWKTLFENRTPEQEVAKELPGW